MRIGDVDIGNPYALAPMAGVNCASFRLLCKECGAGLIFTQMYHSDFICHKLDTEGEEAVFRHINILQAERPVAIQLIGHRPDRMLRAAQCVEKIADIIDINFGCSDDNMIKAKAGAYFLKDTELIVPLVEPIVKACRKPVTAKIRIGWDSHHINGVAVAEMLEQAGVAAITVHGRVATQGYSGKANWEIIGHIKKKLAIPVIGNGDVRTPADASEMLKRTGCDMVMVGRKAMGDPGIFARLSGGDAKPIDMFAKFLTYHAEYDSGKRFTELRTHAIWFAKRCRLKPEERTMVAKAKDVDELRNLFHISSE